MSDGLTDHRSQTPEPPPEPRRPPYDPNGYLKQLENVAGLDVSGLKKAQQSYGDSWKRRGGIGAFMMLARKWDRLEQALRPHAADAATANLSHGKLALAPWDIFGAIELDGRAEGIIDDIRDLRRYLLLVEAEMVARGALSLTNHRDNK